MKILAIVTASLYMVGSALAISDQASANFLFNSTSLDSSKSLSPALCNLRWKDRSSGRAVIPYIISSSFGSTDRSRITSALDDLERRTGSLRFVQRSNQGHYIQVVRRTSSCFAHVGKRGGPQELNLGSNCMSQGTIQHEFLHAMGFHHEHTRPDRDRYVSILFDNIQDRRDKEHNFRRNDDSDTIGSPYDYGSVMHYSANAFAKPGTVTIVPKNGNQISRGSGASSLDIKKLKLLYQCERGIVRDWNTLNNAPCTTDCKCREGGAGCGSNNDACHGSLVCSNNKCVTSSTQTYCGCSTCTQQVWDAIATNDEDSHSCGSRITWVKDTLGYSSTDACDFVTSEFPDICRCSSSACSEPPPSPSPSPSPSNQFLIWQALPGGSHDDFRCVDLMARDTSNGNNVWYYPCNFTPAQYWHRDHSTNYIRSSMDRSKCIVGASGSSSKGTRLVINDCHKDDDRFRWVKYTDGSIRPKNNNRVCIEVDINSGSGLGLYLILNDCHDGYKTFHWLEDEGSGRRKLSMEAEDQNTNRSPERIASELEGTVNYEHSDGCVDSPLGWFDLFGRNCEWYGEDSSNCAVYGDQYANFGKTALSACCVCGGGPSVESAADDGIKAQHAVDAMGQTCWDTPKWYDSTGDGCMWYETENNCEYFGDQFPSDIEGQTANEACCTCGGGLSNPPSSDDDAADAPGCSDSPYDFFDDAGLGCDWYGLEERNCVEFGDLEGADGMTPNEACCACGGGYNPNALEEDLSVSTSTEDVVANEDSGDQALSADEQEDVIEPISGVSGDNSDGAEKSVVHGKEDSGKEVAKEDSAPDNFVNESNERTQDKSSAVSLSYKYLSALAVGALFATFF